MKKLVTLASIPVLVAAAWFGTHWYYSNQVETNLKQTLEQANSQSATTQVTFELVKYEPSAHGQQALIRVKSTNPMVTKQLEDTPLKDGLPFISQIQTGPVLFGEGGMQVAQARIHAELDLNSLDLEKETLDAINKSFANKPPLEINTLLGIAGGGHYEAKLNPASIEEDNKKVSIAGFTLTGPLTETGENKLSVGEMKIDEGKQGLTLSLGAFEGLFNITGESQGTFAAKTGPLKAENPSEGLKYSAPGIDINYKTTGIVAGHLLGSADLGIPQFSFIQAGMLKPFEADLAMHVDSTSQDNSLGGTFSLKADNIKGAEDRIKQLSFESKVNGLDAAGMESFNRQLEALQKLQLQLALESEKLPTTSIPDPAASESGAEQVDKTATQEPELTPEQEVASQKVQDLQAELATASSNLAKTVGSDILQSGKTNFSMALQAANAKGKADTSLKVAYTGKLPAINSEDDIMALAALTPQDWANIFSGKFSLSADKAALPAELRLMLDGYIQGGLIKDKGDTIEHELSVNKGKFSLNGKEGSLEEIMGQLMMGGMPAGAANLDAIPKETDALPEEEPVEPPVKKARHK